MLITLQALNNVFQEQTKGVDVFKGLDLFTAENRSLAEHHISELLGSCDGVVEI